MEIKVGDHVAYSARFLKSIGAVTGDLPFLKGTVTELKPFGRATLATIDWSKSSTKYEETPHTSLVLTAHLAIVGPNTRFCSC